MNATDLDLADLRARLLKSAVPELSRAARARILRPYLDAVRGMAQAAPEARATWLELRRAEYEAAMGVMLHRAAKVQP